MNNEETGGKWEPEPAESFKIEYGVLTGEISEKMIRMGFSFKKKYHEGDEVVVFEGEKPDGTIITIKFEKGSNYKSPKEIAEEEKAEA